MFFKNKFVTKELNVKQNKTNFYFNIFSVFIITSNHYSETLAKS